MAWEPLPQDGRRPLERLGDRALLLLAITRGEEAGRIDQFRLMKIPFAVQHQMNRERIRSFCYRFYRDEHGPISKGIYEDRDTLNDAGLIAGDVRSLRSTKLGDRLSHLLIESLSADEGNRRIFDRLEETAHRYASLPSWEAIKAEVYEMEADGSPATVGEVAPYTDVLEKLPDDQVIGALRLSEQVLGSLSLAFSLTPERIELASTDSGLTIDEVFA